MAFPKPKLWKPKNPEKYAGDSNNIVARSSWETRLFNVMDQQPNVLMWCSEEFNIKYISPVDGKEHRYFSDVLAKMSARDGSEKMFLIEVKPHKERHPPKPKNNKKTFKKEIETYLVNQAKWAAAEAFCSTKGISFLVLDEYDLGISKRPN